MLDLTRVLAGPFCTMILADLGARVIKIERPPAGDDSRAFGPFVEGRSAYFLSLNRGKESIALDLKREEDRVIFRRLTAQADVLVENFRSGTMEKLGLGWEELHSAHPRLIYATLSGFGRTGPDSGRGAYDLVIQALGGIMSITGQPDGPPVRVGTSIADITAGLYSAVGVCAALAEREHTGRGQLVDVAMLDCQVAILENALARLQATGEPPGPLGSRHPSITPFDAYEARDGFLVVAAGNDALFARLCGVLGREGLAVDPRFASNHLRTENHAALKAEFQAVMAQRTCAQWLDALDKAGIPCGPVRNLAQVADDPQVAARNMLVDIADTGLKAAGNPIKLPDHPDPRTRPDAPELDGDRERILAKLAD